MIQTGTTFESIVSKGLFNVKHLSTYMLQENVFHYIVVGPLKFWCLCFYVSDFLFQND